MQSPFFYVQNVYDILNPTGSGVTGHLKRVCMQFQNRAIGMVDSHDIVALSDNCPQSFVDYLLPIKGVQDVLVVRFDVDRKPAIPIDSQTVFQGMRGDSRWRDVVAHMPELSPYLQSPSVYKAARSSGLSIPDDVWETVVARQLVEEMNDKAILHEECAYGHNCEDLEVPVPPHWVIKKENLIDEVLSLLYAGDTTDRRGLFIRQSRSGGGFGSIEVEFDGSSYLVRKLGTERIGKDVLKERLTLFISESSWDEFVVTELLDLYASPGTLFYVSDRGIHIICHNFQLLDEHRHFIGFMYPIVDTSITKHFDAIERVTNRIVEPWRLKGYRGFANIDWMITQDERVFIAEINARQTAVIPPLKIANEIAGQMAATDTPVVEPDLCIFTRNAVYVSDTVSFNDVYDSLHRRGVLLEQNGGAKGTVITLPPSPGLGLSALGFVSVGKTLSEAHDYYERTLNALDAQEQMLLFPYRIG